MDNKREEKNVIRVAIIRNISIVLLCLALGIAISVQYKSMNSRQDSTSSAQEQINSLQSQLIELTKESESLKNDKEELQNKIDTLDSDENKKYLESLIKELEDVKTFAGLTTVKGEGIYIKLEFPASVSYSAMQSYLTLTINDLRASNAQAISINGQRLLAMSELRVGTNGQMIVNGQMITKPYEIYAIGDTSALQSGMILGGNGIIPTMQSKGVEIEWSIKDNIIINACNEDDFRIDMLEPNE